MKLLVIGSGGREHAIAWRLAQSPRVSRVYVAPGNAGTAREDGLFNVDITAIADLVAFAKREEIHATVVGPEGPLAAGVVDAFRAAGLRVFGPTQKAWLCSNFKVEIGGLPCARIATVDSFTWKCAVAADMVGIFRENTKHPAKVTVPDLKLGISYADHDAWAQAAKKWFIDGAHEEQHEMNGSITFLGPDMKKELGRIDLMNVGFKKFSDEDAEANSEKIKRFNVELYVEKMAFSISHYDL